MEDKEDITKRILETRKQSEELKAQLQSLIYGGLNNVQEALGGSHGNEKEKISNKLQIIKSYETKHSSHINKPDYKDHRSTIPKLQKTDKTQEEVANKVSPAKVRSYNVSAAREYIKKQREKRLEQSKTQNNEKLKADIQKKKLQELHKKSMELVSKNVQAKRDRSKSKDRTNYVRPVSNDRSHPETKRAPDCIKKAKLTGGLTKVSSDQQKNSNLLYPPSPNYVQCRMKCTENQVNVKHEKPIKYSPVIREDFLLNKPIDTIVISAEESFKPVKPINLFNIPNEKNTEKYCLENTSQLDNNTSEPVKNILDYKVYGSQSNNLCSNILGYTADESLKSISHKNNYEFSERIQLIDKKNNLPEWLQDKPEDACPFNFISTIRRKLQFAINSPKLSDNIELSNEKTPKFNSEIFKSKELNKYSPDLTKKSKGKANYKSISPKCLNLDSRPIDHLELIPNPCKDKNTLCAPNENGLHRQFLKSENESESDTSKNIPDISSESGTSLKKNAESVNRNLNSVLTINTEKINSMKLVPQVIKSVSIITLLDSQKLSEQTDNTNTKGKSISNGQKLSIQSEYVPDFYSDELDLSDQDLCRSRESIISFNSPTYSKQVINHPLPQSLYPIEQASENRDNTESTRKEQTNRTFKNPIPVIELTTTRNFLTEETHSENIPYIKMNKINQNESRHSKDIPDSKSIMSSYKTQPVSNIPSDTDESVKVSSGSKSTFQYTSLHTELHPSRSLSGALVKSDADIHSINTQRGSSGLSSIDKLTECIPEKKALSSIIEAKPQTCKNSDEIKKSSSINIALGSNRNGDAQVLNNANEIHLKFEAEIHLLNDFNESLHQFAAVEKAFKTLKTESNVKSKKASENKDVQTSITTRASTMSNVAEHVKTTSEISSVNYSRGSVADENMDSLLLPADESIGTEISKLNMNRSSFVTENDENSSIFHNFQAGNFAGLSLNMFEQLIKDEDARLENLKTILKIREQVLLDRTKGELAWLEIQRKHFKETGQLHEASVVKKKQRGILVNHQKEKHEMQRLKQMQKAASVERKTILKEQRNLIRRQLSTDSMLTKIKVSTPRERRLSGPLKVLQSCTGSITSDTSVSKKSLSANRDKEVYSITSHHSVISKKSEISGDEVSLKEKHTDMESTERQAFIKKTLLMREAALHKRRNAAEELLQWHKKLLLEEKRIKELELTASAIISQKSNNASVDIPSNYKFRGKQLNQLWYNLTGWDDKKFTDDKTYSMSQIALERFCRNAREYSTNSKKLLQKLRSAKSDKDYTVSENIPEQGMLKTENSSKVDSTSNTTEYTSDFDVESVDIANNEDMDSVDQNINQLIDNFSKIQDDISTMSVIQSKKSDDETEIGRMVDAEICKSVSETNRLDSLKFADKENTFSKSSDRVFQRLDVMEKPANSDQITSKLEENEKEKTETSFQIQKDRIDTDVSNLSATEYGEAIPDAKTILNESKEILLLLKNSEQGSDTLSSKQSSIPEDDLQKENISTTQDILFNLSQIHDKICSERSANEFTSSHSSDLKNELDKSNEAICTSDTKTNLLEETNSDIYTNQSLSEENNVVCTKSLEFHLALSDSDKQARTVEINDKIKSSESDMIEGDEKSNKSQSVEEIFKENIVNIIESQPKSTSCLVTDIVIHPEFGEIKENETVSASEMVNSVQTENDIETEDMSLSDRESCAKSNLANKIERTISTKSSVTDKNYSELEKDDYQENSNSSQRMTDNVEIKSDIIADKITAYGTLSPQYSEDSPSTSDVYEDEDEVTCNQNVSENDNRTEYTDKRDETFPEAIIKSADNETDTLLEGYTDIKSGTNYFEEKEQDCLSPSTADDSLSSVKTELTEGQKNSVSPNINSSDDKSPSERLDVKKRVSEIMADTNQVSRSDKSLVLQDIYVTTYDLVSPANSPEIGSPTEDHKLVKEPGLFGSEAEEILRKQLAIEQEIKQITEQQQKEQIPLVFIREIPNKPPPPYTPPSLPPCKNILTIIPKCEEIEQISKYSSKILHKAYLSNNLDNIFVSESTLNLIPTTVSKECYKFVFNLCKEISQEHYKQFDTEKCPSWLKVSKKVRLATIKPFNVNELEKYINKKLKEFFGYETPNRRENAVIKWSRKKRDHVDEILVVESQAEEVQWTNFDKDELLVMDQVTNNIFNKLLKETGDVLNRIFYNQRNCR